MLDSNIPSFTRQTADRLTRIHVSDVCKTELTENYREDGSKSVILSFEESTTAAVCHLEKRRKLNSNAVLNPPQSTYPLYTLKIPWCGDDTGNGSCLSVTDVCKNIRQEYNNSDIMIYDTTRDKIKFKELGVCTGREIISFVYINGKFENTDRFMDSVRNVCTGDADNRVPVILLLDGMTVGVDLDDFRCFEHIIKLNRHNCSRSQVSKFMAYIVKSFQKYQTVLDLNTGIAAAKHTIINYDLYTFMGLPSAQQLCTVDQC